MISTDGSLIIKILKRTAEFRVESVDFSESHRDSSCSLQIPKKTKVFVEQTIRERDNAPAIYNNFLTELWRLRLTAARETVDVINSAESTISGDIGHAPIKLAAEVCGLGPVFQLFLIVENMATRRMATDLSVILHCDHRHYALSKPYRKVQQQKIIKLCQCFMIILSFLSFQLPPIVPGAPIKIGFEITAIVDSNDGLQPSDLTPETANVRVMILKVSQSKPLLAATIAMPTPELFQEDIY